MIDKIIKLLIFLFQKSFLFFFKYINSVIPSQKILISAHGVACTEITLKLFLKQFAGTEVILFH